MENVDLPLRQTWPARDALRRGTGWWRLAMVLAVVGTGAPAAGAHAGAASAAANAAAEIYVSTGEHGETSFSDQAGPGRQRVRVEVTDGVEDPQAELERRIAQTLAVADSLESSRLARERARAHALDRAAEARAAAKPEVIYHDRYVTSPYLYPRPRWPDHRPRPHHKPSHEELRERPREGPATISKAFPASD